MEETTLPNTLPFSGTSSVSPCLSNEASTKIEDYVEDAVPQWLENEAFPGFRVWQLAGIILSVLLSIIVGLCCCIRFRVPRTKQEIEADYIRKKITKSFRNKLSKISNTEMDEMDLQKGNMISVTKIENNYTKTPVWDLINQEKRKRKTHRMNKYLNFNPILS